MMRFSIISVCFFYFCKITQADVTPVLIWGYDNITNNLNKGLCTLSDADFVNEIVFPLLADHVVIVFLEKDLLTRDFQCRLPQNNTPCFEELQRIENKVFFQQVKHPLKSLLPYANKHQMSLNGSLDLEIDCFNSLHLISFSENMQLERETQLNQHDQLMSRLIQRYEECAAVYMYMSSEKEHISERKERAPDDLDLVEYEVENSTDVNNITDNAVFLFYDEHFAIAYKKITLQTTYDSGEVDDEELQVTNMFTGAADNEESFDVIMSLNNGEEIAFQMTHTGSNCYEINEMSYANASYNPIPMGSALAVPANFCYFCAAVRLTRSEDEQLDPGVIAEALLWENLQFQHTLEPAHSHKPNSSFEEDDEEIFKDSAETFKFYEAWNCDGVFTAGSLMGTVILLLTSVGFGVGLYALLNIDAPPRFEDPRMPAFEGGT